MIEGIKKIREAFRKITAGLRKDGTINARPGYESYIKEKLKEKEEVPGKAIMFVDGEKNAELTQIKKAALKTGEAENVWAVCGASAEELKDYQRYYLAFEECEKYYYVTYKKSGKPDKELYFDERSVLSITWEGKPFEKIIDGEKRWDIEIVRA